MRAKPAVAAVVLTVSLTLAGCGAGSSSDSAGKARGVERQADGARGEKGGEDGGAAVAATGAPGAEGKAADGRNPAVVGAQVIRTAELTVEVRDARKALGTARTAAEKAGGLVRNETTERVEDDEVTSTLVLRVPQDAYDAVLTELAGTGKLVARTSSAKDVTDQVVDVNSRVASQRASVARVRELMDRATRLSDVVALEGELSTRQADLESLLARQASLKDRTTLATITLRLSEAPVRRAEGKDDAPGFLDGLGGGWGALVATVRWIAVVIGAVAPFVAVSALLFALWRLLVRGRFPRRRAAAAVPPPAEAPVEAPAEAPVARGGERDRSAGSA